MPPRFRIETVPPSPDRPDFAKDVMEGLSARPKRLPPVHFYDERGSALFEAISNLPEYYVTRTEHSILERTSDEIARCLGGPLTLIELGSGSSRKTSLLIRALLHRHGELHYVPVDICKRMLVESSKRLLQHHSGLTIRAYLGDYSSALVNFNGSLPGPKMVAFLGSNLGNFTPGESLVFLRKIRALLSVGDFLLLGLDMQKEVSILGPAYDDAQGVTSAFNLNLLARINRELGGRFDLEQFSHVAFYNQAAHRIEMHLRSRVNQTVYVERLGCAFTFAAGEMLHTENSYKYSRDQVGQLAQESGFSVHRFWQDERGYFSVNLLAPV